MRHLCGLPTAYHPPVSYGDHSLSAHLSDWPGDQPDIIAESSIDLDGTLRVTDQYKGLICGIKSSYGVAALEILGMEMPRLAKRAARESGIKLMVHIGDTTQRYDPTVIRSLLPC